MATQTNILLETGTNELEIVEFIIEFVDENGAKKVQPFGVNVAKVREIIRMPQLTKLPNLPDSVYGVFNLRGVVIPALDLRKYLYNLEFEPKDQKMIITEFNKLRVGLIVNDVSRIHRISWTDIVTPDAMQDFDSDKSSIVGIIHIGESTILMLDIEKIVADIDPSSAIDIKQKVEKFEKKLKAVTAEDSPTIRRMITDRLKVAGFEIEAYHNGEEAWKRLKEISALVAKGARLDDYCDVVITDIEMPMMDGYTLTKMIKSDPILQQIPVVIFSSIVSEDILHKGKVVGANAQLTKPQIGELLSTVRYLIENKS